MKSKLKPKFLIKLLTIVLAIVAILLLVVPFGEKTLIEKTLASLQNFDEKHTTSIDDYKNGMEYLNYKPRYPTPINPGDVEGLVKELESIKEKAQGDKASILLLDARIDLLKSEGFYKLGRRTKKGSTFDGFNCDQGEFIMNASRNFNSSVEYGRSAVLNLQNLYDSYQKVADGFDISPYKIKSINESFDQVADRSKKNEGTWIGICLEGDIVDFDSETILDMVPAADVVPASE